MHEIHKVGTSKSNKRNDDPTLCYIQKVDFYDDLLKIVILGHARYMSQMLYAGQSDREDVTFFTDLKQLYRAQFMYRVHEILIHWSQPICNQCIKISWTLANFMA